MTTVFSTRSLSFAGGRLVSEATGKSAVIGPEPVVLGRDAACGFVVDESGVSSVHAEVEATPEGLRLRDLGSKNGTWIDAASVREVVLTDACVFALGRAELRFVPGRPETIALPDVERFGAMYGTSPAMRDLFRRLAKVAPTELTVLVQGETGTGKELVASAIHQASARKDGPFVVVDCGGIAPTLAEAMLFGHEKGAYTGADTARRSPFLDANGGTIFLDELGELPLDVQPKLLRALAERRIKPVGSNKWLPFDARVVAATRRDLESAVASGAFRSDLYFRLAEVRIAVPPLRQRQDDIPGLVRHMLEQLGAKTAWRRIPRTKLTPLYAHSFPGNVRELRSAVAVALALAGENDAIDIAGALGAKARATKGARNQPGVARGYHEAKRAALGQFERAYFAQLVESTAGNIAEISRLSGLQRTHVRKYLKAHGLR